MAIQGLGFLPCLWVTWTCVGIAITLSMTIKEGHVMGPFPYISDTGANSPESILFTVIISVSAVLGAGTVYVYYKFMTIRSRDLQVNHPVAHKILLLIGWTSCGGIMGTAFLQERRNSNWHQTGAMLAFGCGLLYNISQAICLHRLPNSNKIIFHLKVAFCLVAILSFITMIACKLQLIYACHGRHGRHCKIVNITAISAEWILAATLMLKILTYVPDFQISISHRVCQ